MRSSLSLLTVLALSSVSAAAGVEIPTFTDRTDDAGLTFTHSTNLPIEDMSERHIMTPGVAVADFDRDGYLDLYVAGGAGQNARLFINRGDGTFDDRAAAWGIDAVAMEGSAVSAADINADGHIDVYAGALDGRAYVFLNTGQEIFAEIGLATRAVLKDGIPFDVFGTAWGDIEGDGDLDLVTTDWLIRGNTLFLNDGTGRFTDDTAASRLFDPPPVWGFTPAIVDLDGDRAPEVVIAADFGTSQYYANVGDGRFERLTQMNGTGWDENGMGSTLGDYDNDGDLDWFVTSIYDGDGHVEGNWGTTGNRLYRNDGEHLFTDVTGQSGARQGDWGWGTNFGDVNHDGRLDLAMTNGFTPEPYGNPDETFETDPTRLWLGRSAYGGRRGTGFTYQEVAAAAGLVHTADGRSLIMFDADNDGDLDIVITTNRGPLQFFDNEFDPAADRWLEVDLVSPPGTAPDGIGAVIELTAGGTTYYRTMIAAPSFMGHGPLRAHFGFPPVKVIDALVVRWPDGTTTTQKNVTPGRVIEVRAGEQPARSRLNDH